jgi:hypothetical protein
MLAICGYETDEGFIHLILEFIQLDIKKKDLTTLKDIAEIKVKLDKIYNDEKRPSKK